MVQIFRKIRQKLLVENKISQYLTYAIGEIFLVVIGILIALQVNNWSVENNSKIKEEWYLNNIAKDLEYQKGILLSQKLFYQESIDIAKSILRDYKKTNSIRKIDSLNQKLNELIEVNIFSNANDTYKEMLSSGQQNIIRDKKISNGIINYYLFCEDTEKDIINNIDNVFYRDIQPVLNSYLQITVPPYEEQFVDEEGLFEPDEEVSNFLLTKLGEKESLIKFMNALKSLIIINLYNLELVSEAIELEIILMKEINLYLGLPTKKGSSL